MKIHEFRQKVDEQVKMQRSELYFPQQNAYRDELVVIAMRHMKAAHYAPAWAKEVLRMYGE